MAVHIIITMHADNSMKMVIQLCVRGASVSNRMHRTYKKKKFEYEHEQNPHPLCQNNFDANSKANACKKKKKKRNNHHKTMEF